MAKIPNSSVDHIYARTKIMVCQTQSSKQCGTILQEELIVHRKQLQADKCAFLVLISNVFSSKKNSYLMPVSSKTHSSCLFWNKTGMNSPDLQICCCLSKDLQRLCMRKKLTLESHSQLIQKLELSGWQLSWKYMSSLYF